MLIKLHNKTENIIYNKEKKGCKYGVIANDTVVYINRGRVEEYYIRNSYGYTELDLETTPHWIAGDIKIDNQDFNIKSYKCELRAEGITIQEKIDNYIAKDASQGMIYIIEHNEQVVEIRMTWEEAKEFINNFGRLDRGAIRITTCDNKIYNWAMEKIA